jgi:hypothetical protein
MLLNNHMWNFSLYHQVSQMQTNSFSEMHARVTQQGNDPTPVVICFSTL